MKNFRFFFPAVDNEEFADDEVELNPNEMTVGQMLGQDMEDDGYAYDYDEEEYWTTYSIFIYNYYR